MDSGFVVDLPVSLPLPDGYDEQEDDFPLSPTEFLIKNNNQDEDEAPSEDDDLSISSGDKNPVYQSRLFQAIHNRKLRPIVMTAIVIIIISVAFIINAVLIVVSVLDSDRENLTYKIHSLNLSDLCDETMQMAFKGSFYNPTLATFKFGNGKFDVMYGEDLLTTVNVDQVIKFESHKTVDIVLNTPIKIQDDAINRLIHTISAGKIDDVKFTINTKFNIETHAFWIPIHVTQTITIEAEDKVVDKLAERKIRGFGIEKIHILESNNSVESLHAMVQLGNLGKGALPTYIQVEIPEMSFEVFRNDSQGNKTSLGKISNDKHNFLSDPSMKSPYNFMVQASEGNVIPIRSLISDILNQKYYKVTLESTCKKKCRLANWMSNFWLSLKENEEKVEQVLDLAHAEIRRFQKTREKSLQLAMDVKLWRRAFQILLSSDPFFPFEISGLPEYLNFSINLSDFSEKHVNLIDLHLHYLKEHDHDLNLPYYPFELQVNMFNMTDFGRMIVGFPWMGLEISGAEKGHFISRVIKHRVHFRNENEKLKPNMDNHPPYVKLDDIVANQSLDVSVQSTPSSAFISCLLDLQKRPVVRDGVALSMSWPKIEMDIGKDGVKYLEWDLGAGNISYVFSPQNVLALFHGDPVNLNITFNDLDKSISRIILDFFNRKPIDGTFFATYKMNNEITNITDTWKGLDTIAEDFLASVDDKPEITSDGQSTGLHSSISPLMAVQGLEVMGFDSSAAYVAVAVVGRLINKPRAFKNVGPDATLNLDDPDIKTWWDKRKGKVSVNIETRISLPEFEFQLRRDDPSKEGDLMFFHSQAMVIESKAFLDYSRQGLTELTVKSNPKSERWNSYKSGFLENSLLLRFGFVNETLGWNTVREIIDEYKDMRVDNGAPSDQTMVAVRINPAFEGTEFSSKNLISRLITFFVKFKFTNEDHDLIRLVRKVPQLNPIPDQKKENPTGIIESLTNWGLLKNMVSKGFTTIKDFHWVTKLKPEPNITIGSRDPLKDAPVISEHSEMDLMVDLRSDNLKDILVNVTLAVPKEIYAMDNNKSLIINNFKSPHLAENFLIQWGNINVTFSDPNKRNRLGELFLRRGRAMVSLGTNKEFNLDSEDSRSFMSNDHALNAHFKLFGDDSSGQRLTLQEKHISVLEQILANKYHDLEFVMAGQYDIYNVESAQGKPFDFDRFDLKILAPLFNNTEAKSYVESDEISFVERVSLSFNESYLQSVQNLPCISGYTCNPDHVSSIGSGINLGVVVDMKEMKPAMERVLNDIAFFTLMGLSSYQRPEYVRLSLSVSKISMDLTVDGVGLVSLTSPVLKFSHKVGIARSETDVELDFRHNIEVGIFKDIEGVKLLAQNLPLRDFFILTNPKLQSYYDKFYKKSVSFVSDSSLLSQLIASTITLSSKKDSPGPSPKLVSPALNLAKTSPDRLQLDMPLRIQFPLGSGIPKLNIGDFGIDIRYGGFKVFEVVVAEPELTRVEKGSELLIDIKFVGIKDLGNGLQLDSLYELISVFADRHKAFDLSLTVKHGPRGLPMNEFLKTNMHMMRRLGKTDFIVRHGFSGLSSLNGPYFIELYNSLPMAMYFTAAKIRWFLYPSQNIWLSTSDKPKPIKEITQTSIHRRKPIDPETNEALLYAPLKIPSNSSTYYYIGLYDFAGGNKENIISFSRKFLNSLISNGAMMQINATIGFNSETGLDKGISEGNTSFFVRIKLDVPYMKIGFDPIARMQCLPDLEAGEKLSSKVANLNTYANQKISFRINGSTLTKAACLEVNGATSYQHCLVKNLESNMLREGPFDVDFWYLPFMNMTFGRITNSKGLYLDSFIEIKKPVWSIYLDQTIVNATSIPNIEELTVYHASTFIPGSRTLVTVNDGLIGSGSSHILKMEFSDTCGQPLLPSKEFLSGNLKIRYDDPFAPVRDLSSSIAGETISINDISNNAAEMLTVLNVTAKSYGRYVVSLDGYGDLNQVYFQ